MFNFFFQFSCQIFFSIFISYYQLVQNSQDWIFLLPTDKINDDWPIHSLGRQKKIHLVFWWPAKYKIQKKIVFLSLKKRTRRKNCFQLIAKISLRKLILRPRFSIVFFSSPHKIFISRFISRHSLSENKSTSVWFRFSEQSWNFKSIIYSTPQDPSQKKVFSKRGHDFNKSLQQKQKKKKQENFIWIIVSLRWTRNLFRSHGCQNHVSHTKTQQNNN